MLIEVKRLPMYFKHREGQFADTLNKFIETIEK